MKVLLTTINSKYIHQNLAVRILYGLNKNFDGLSWKEFHNKDNLDEITSYCTNFQIVAFSCYIWNIAKILHVASKIKSLNPECKLLLGGPEVTYEWEEIIQLEEVDFIIAGEGEISFSSFLHNYPDFEKVPGLIWKKNGNAIKNTLTESFDLRHLKNLNPYIEEPTGELINKICYIEASRGCPHRCTFCMAGLDHQVRYLPMETIQSNLLYLMQHGRIIKFLDRTFNTNPDFAISIFTFILQNHKPGNIFQFEIKADKLQPQLIDFIQRYVPKGIFRFEIGVQTITAKANEAIKRKQNFEQVKKFISQIADKIEIHVDLIVGLPYDYMNDIKYSFEEVFRLFAPELQLGFLKFLKGTPIRESHKKYDYQFNTLPPYQILQSRYLTKTELHQISLVEQALEIYWNKKRAIQTLKYIAVNYSIFEFLLGLAKYFETKNGFGKYGLNEIYNNIFEFSSQNYPKDIIIQQLIALDYYLQYKVKPKIRFLPEPDKSRRKEIFSKYKLNHHKYRYIIHQLNFKAGKYINDGIVDLSDDLLIIQYDGINKPLIIP